MDGGTAPTYTPRMECEDILDARGLLCPLPVLKARKRLNSMSPGMVLKVLADDPAAVVDIPHYCAESGNELVDKSADGDVQVYLIRKTQKAPSQVSPKEA